MPTKSTIAPSFHRQVIVVFVCVPASLPRACSLPGERLAACCCWSVLRRCWASQSVRGVCERVVEHAGRLFAAFIKVVCASGVFGFITSRYLNCLLDLILNAFTPKTSVYYTRVLAYWYSNQECRLRWHSSLSACFYYMSMVLDKVAFCRHIYSRGMWETWYVQLRMQELAGKLQTMLSIS